MFDFLKKKKKARRGKSCVTGCSKGKRNWIGRGCRSESSPIKEKRSTNGETGIDIQLREGD